MNRERRKRELSNGVRDALAAHVRLHGEKQTAAMLGLHYGTVARALAYLPLSTEPRLVIERVFSPVGPAK
jgi:hypothetical protein